eukprot:NODE_1482_length_891_cov_241.604513_g1146_i0.p1 GENE.NODE_1482_length_891_cov_241.604513_g1146_i0~~NODE_1482_length_891_cov_241.604513_g1146_i0.p1  ORF type:complete len:211 (+),score=38.42 NODE_1482_length_891_cov_241.604513_g1146_i0:70-702(+)
MSFIVSALRRLRLLGGRLVPVAAEGACPPTPTGSRPNFPSLQLNVEHVLRLGKAVPGGAGAGGLRLGRAIGAVGTALPRALWTAICSHPKLAVCGLAALGAASFLASRLRSKVRLLNEDYFQKNLPSPTQEELLDPALFAVPTGFCCPLTHSLMRDPVLTPSGHTYERSALLRFLEDCPRDPFSNQPLTPEQLIPNRALRAVIDEWEQAA